MVHVRRAARRVAAGVEVHFELRVLRVARRVVAGFLLIFATSISAELRRERRSHAVPASSQNR